MSLKQGYFSEELKVEDRFSYMSNAKMQSVLDDPGKFFGSYSPDAPKRKTTAAMDWGKKIHLRALEPEKFKRVMQIAPEFKGKGSREAKLAWESTRDPNAIWTDEDELKQIELAFDGLMRNRYAKHLLERSTTERFGYAYHKELSIWLHSRPDIHTEWQDMNWVTDLKTCTDLDDESIKMALYGRRYYAQVMLYVLVDEIINGISINEGAAVIFSQSTYPYNSRVVGLDPLWQGMGRIKIIKAGNLYRDLIKQDPSCIDPNKWKLPELGESSPEYWMLRKDMDFAPLMELGQSTQGIPL